MNNYTQLLRSIDSADGGNDNQFHEDQSSQQQTVEQENKSASFNENDVAESVFEGDSFKPTTTVVKSENDKTLEETAKLNKLEVEAKERELVEQETIEAARLKVEKAKAEKTSTPEKKEVAEEEDDSQLTPEQKKAKEDSKARDYSGLPKEDVEYLKKLPNHIFKVVAPIAKERAKLAAEVVQLKETLEKSKDPNRIPDNWYEHERAIELTPEYQRLANEYERFTMESDHWQKQITRVSNGMPYTTLTAFDPKSGRYTESAPQAVPEDPNAKVELIVQLEKAKNQGLSEKMVRQQRATELSAKFKLENKNISTYYDEEIDRVVKGLPKDLQPTKEQIEGFYDLVHPAHKSSSQTKVSANLFAICANQGKVIKQLLAEKEKGVKTIEDRRAAGPSNRTSLTTSGRTNGSRPIIGEDGKVKKDSLIDFSKLDEEFTGE